MSDNDILASKFEGYGVLDNRGREIGGRYKVRFYEEGAYQVLSADGRSLVGVSAHFEMQPWATRNGKEYGAIQSGRVSKTLEGAVALGEEYLAKAKARALKAAAKAARTAR